MIIQDVSRRGFLRGLFRLASGAVLTVAAPPVVKAAAFVLPDDDALWIRLRSKGYVAMTGRECVGVVRQLMLDHANCAPFWFGGDRDTNEAILTRLRAYGDAIRLVRQPA